ALTAGKPGLKAPLIRSDGEITSQVTSRSGSSMGAGLPPSSLLQHPATAASIGPSPHRWLMAATTSWKYAASTTLPSETRATGVLRSPPQAGDAPLRPRSGTIAWGRQTRLTRKTATAPLGCGAYVVH